MKRSRLLIFIGLFFAVLWFVSSLMGLLAGKANDNRLLAPLALVPILVGISLAKKEGQDDSSNKRK